MLSMLINAKHEQFNLIITKMLLITSTQSYMYAMSNFEMKNPM